MRALECQLERWQQEIGSTPATIRVKPFFSSSRCIGTSGGLEIFEGLENILSEEELAEEVQKRQDWIDAGCWVFCWASDLHMADDGSVMSS
jgi:hypothetical protein